MASKRRAPASRAPAVRLLDETPAAPGALGRALATAVARFGSRPGVTGIDLGFKIKGGRHTRLLSIRIHVREKTAARYLSGRERFPRRILGVPVDVIEAVYEPHPFDPQRQARLPVVQPGVSVGTLEGPTGTLGLLAMDVVDGSELVLGSAHVFAPSVDARPGDPVLQPGRVDGGGPQDTIGVLHRIDEPTDSAVALAMGSRPFAAGIVQGPPAVTGLRYPRLDDVLEKSGRSTGVSRGRIDGMALTFAGLRFVFRLVPLDGDTQPLCDFGDSGAVWYDPLTGEAVGLHCKGGDTPHRVNAYAIATSLPHAMASLGARLP